MTDRLATHMLVSALIRSAQDRGGFATVLHKGDSTSGVILLQCLEKGRETGFFERMSDFSGGFRLVPCGPGQSAANDQIAQYIERRRTSDRDIWLIELDIADAERLAADILC